MVPDAAPGAPPLPLLPALVTPLLVLPAPPLPPCDEDETPLLLADAPPAPVVVEAVVLPPLEQAAAAATHASKEAKRGRVKSRALRGIDPESTTNRAPSARLVVGSSWRGAPEEQWRRLIAGEIAAPTLAGGRHLDHRLPARTD